MEFEWDPDKAEQNLREHRIDFADAVGVFDSPRLTREDSDVEGERRFVTLGIDGLGRLLVVVYTHREDTVRVISARKATKKERNEYAQRVRFQ